MAKRQPRKPTGIPETSPEVQGLQDSSNEPQQTVELSKINKQDWIKNLFDSRTPHEQAVLTEDIKRNGLSTPITLTSFDGDEFVLIDGFGRCEAYETLGKAEIAYKIQLTGTEDAIKAFMYRRQLGRRNLSPQAKAAIIGRLPDSKSVLVKELGKSENYISECRRYAKALDALKDSSIDNLSELPISTVISTAKEYAERAPLNQAVESASAEHAPPIVKPAPKLRIKRSIKEGLLRIQPESTVESLEVLIQVIEEKGLTLDDIIQQLNTTND